MMPINDSAIYFQEIQNKYTLIKDTLHFLLNIAINFT